MTSPTALERLTRRLNFIGTGLVAAAFLAFVWAVGFTRGVDALIEGLVIAGVGLLIPGVASFWVSWIIGQSSSDVVAVPTALPATTREHLVQRLRNYTIAAACVAVAAIVRGTLSPYLGQIAPFPTFFLAVTLAAWFGGMGPAVFASALSVGAVWLLFINTAQPIVDATGELVATGLFLAVSLAIAGITSALRLTQTRAASLSQRNDEQRALLQEVEQRLRDLADRSGVMLRLTSAAGDVAYLNQPWTAYTGRADDAQSGEAWLEALHPDDRNRFRARLAKAVEAREPYALEYRLKRADDAYVRHRETGTPRFHDDGRFAGYVAEIVDVNDVSRTAHASGRTPADGPPAERGTVE